MVNISLQLKVEKKASKNPNKDEISFEKFFIESTLKLLLSIFLHSIYVSSYRGCATSIKKNPNDIRGHSTTTWTEFCHFDPTPLRGQKETFLTAKIKTIHYVKAV